MDSAKELEIMTKCPHGKLYEKCCYGCKLWAYTRTWRRHEINDGECYGEGVHVYLWDISSAAPYGHYQGKYGYDLYYKGKLIKHGQTVKDLKQFVQKKYSEL